MLPEDADAQYLHDLADSRNWGYSILFVNETDEVSTILSLSLLFRYLVAYVLQKRYLRLT